MLKNGTVICFTIEFPTDRIICTRNDHLCWHGKKMWNNTEQFQLIRSSVTSLTMKGLVFAVFTRHIR